MSLRARHVIRRTRLLVVLTRPAVVVLLGMFTAIGLARTGHGGDPWRMARALVVVMAFLLFSVACNDLADEAIDRVNLPGDPRRPLASGAAGRRDMIGMAALGAMAALAVSATLHWPAVAVTAAGLWLSAGYSLRPVRIAGRGALASLMLPACYVAVPYLVGVFAGRGSVRAGDLTLLGGLYLGFIGRILLKDFRDVRGDALFGKRTFLVRHGRRSTCAVSAACWTAGTAVSVAALNRPGPALIGFQAGCVLLALALLRMLAATADPRKDERVIAAIAIVGRGMMLGFLFHLSATGAGVPVRTAAAALGLVLMLTFAQAVRMVRRGPVTRLTVPAAWLTEREHRPARLP